MASAGASRPSGPRGALWLAIVLAAGAISAMTVPGQTAGLSVFTDPLIAEVGIDRTQISLSYLVGTLTGAAAQPIIGRASDRWSPRTVLIVIACALAAFLVGLSFVTEVFGLTAGFVGVRMAGQGALSLAVTTAVARAISSRRGLALGLSTAIGSAGISLAPIGIERLIDAVGIRAAWRWEALIVLAVVVPAAMFFRRRVDHADHVAAHRDEEEWTVGEAVRTGMFWVLSLAVATTSMLGTALQFHQIALLGEQGLEPWEAAANFLPQTVTALLATVLVGALVDRVNPRIIIVAAMLAMGGALLLVSFVEPGWRAILYGLVLGSAGGSLRGMEAATFVRYFGTKHIGQIRGFAGVVSLGASALGPFVLAYGREMAGGFVTPSIALAVIPAAVIVAGVFVRAPRRRGPSGSPVPR
ncbi:MFS transporter [Microbacterium suaedae]|uniref:MFS transporter n=1 Tax=Microbacterium suaedae TaxID=2067813 RepID=UPI001E2AE7DB|nr:MFS transporter [Microbacterium suaedae]